MKIAECPQESWALRDSRGHSTDCWRADAGGHEQTGTATGATDAVEAGIRSQV
ncbi:MAG: hypothetical protein Q4A03_04795 [Rothia sp. (in: high G+C Gram-positive bacteria)]|nr:hypothetical protein [Rothia sp. (in: high G+C Gram-positive bacteria)]